MLSCPGSAAMQQVDRPSRNSAPVSRVLRPKRRWIMSPPSVPSGRTKKASANSANARNVPSSGPEFGKNTVGNTSAEAMP